MRRLSGFLIAVVFLSVFTTATAAQEDEWQNKWYWGAQAGVFLYSPLVATGESSMQSAWEVGGHWLITRERVGFHLALAQVLYGNDATASIADGTVVGQTISFTTGQRLQAELYAIPLDGKLQVYAGGGFLINHVTDAVPVGTFATPQLAQSIQQEIDDLSTKAFFTISGGVQYRMGRLAVFGTYQFIPEGRDFLIASTQHAITGGLRYALTASNQDVTTDR